MSRENKKRQFPQNLIINETIPGNNTDEEIQHFLSERHLYDVNSLNEYGHSPLCTAVHAGSMKFVKTLVEIGADVNLKDNDGWTALHFATATKQYDIAKYLMTVGADMKATTNDGLKPLEFVKDKNIKIFLAKYGTRCDMSNLKTSYC